MPGEITGYSDDGTPIYRYDDVEPEFQSPENPAEYLPAIEKHIETHIGPIESVFHEIVSSHVHLDVMYVKATEERPYHWFITSGMADQPMAVPEGAEEYAHAELCVVVPADWPVERFIGDVIASKVDKTPEEQAEIDRAYWPVGWMKLLARFPHEYDTWFGWGHTMPNGDPAEPLSDVPGCQVAGWILLDPVMLPEEFAHLEAGTFHAEEYEREVPHPVINFYQCFPLTNAEMDFKLQNGADAMLEKLGEANVPTYIVADRPSAV